jgi:hypothetical protein
MMRYSALLVTMALAAGCTGDDSLVFEGDDMARYFPFDGDRTWTYVTEDTTVPYLLVGQSAEDSELLEDGRTRVYTVNFTYQCFGVVAPCDVDDDNDGVADVHGTQAFSWAMSANTTSGVNIHGHSDTTFVPPIQLATARMVKGEDVASETSGINFTSSYVSQGECPAPYWGDNPPGDCVKFLVDDGGVGSPMAGEFWSIYQFNIVAFTLESDGVPWQLRDYEDVL